MKLDTTRALASLAKAQAKKGKRSASKKHVASRPRGTSPEASANTTKSLGKRSRKSPAPALAEVTEAFNHRKGRKPANLDKVIKVLTGANPRKVGSHGYKAFELYSPGMTVGAYFLAGGASNHLNWDLAKGFIALE